MSYVIERTDDGVPVYFSLKVARDYASPTGGWSQDMRKALQFGRVCDTEAFANAYLKDMAPWCSAVPAKEQEA
jgi:hypothetical protein